MFVKIHVVQREFSILITFPDVHGHVIRICSKIGPKSLYYSTGSLVEFHEKLQGDNSPFLLHFLMHIHVLMLCRKFELILIKIGFLKKNFNLLRNLVKVTVLYRVFGQISSKITRRKFSIFITFSNTYICTYVV